MENWIDFYIKEVRLESVWKTFSQSPPIKMKKHKKTRDACASRAVVAVLDRMF